MYSTYMLKVIACSVFTAPVCNYIVFYWHMVHTLKRFLAIHHTLRIALCFYFYFLRFFRTSVIQNECDCPRTFGTIDKTYTFEWKTHKIELAEIQQSTILLTIQKYYMGNDVILIFDTYHVMIMREKQI